MAAPIKSDKAPAHKLSTEWSDDFFLARDFESAISGGVLDGLRYVTPLASGQGQLSDAILNTAGFGAMAGNGRFVVSGDGLKAYSDDCLCVRGGNAALNGTGTLRRTSPGFQLISSADKQSPSSSASSHAAAGFRLSTAGLQLADALATGHGPGDLSNTGRLELADENAGFLSAKAPAQAARAMPELASGSGQDALERSSRRMAGSSLGSGFPMMGGGGGAEFRLPGVVAPTAAQSVGSMGLSPASMAVDGLGLVRAADPVLLASGAQSLLSDQQGELVSGIGVTLSAGKEAESIAFLPSAQPSSALREKSVVYESELMKASMDAVAATRDASPAEIAQEFQAAGQLGQWTKQFESTEGSGGGGPQGLALTGVSASAGANSVGTPAASSETTLELMVVAAQNQPSTEVAAAQAVIESVSTKGPETGPVSIVTPPAVTVGDQISQSVDETANVSAEAMLNPEPSAFLMAGLGVALIVFSRARMRRQS